MKQLLAFLLCIALSQSFAQNTFPTNGNVGINTTTPSARLDVNGNMRVDSCLLVKDSLLVQKDMRGEGDLKVEGDSYFLGQMNALGEAVFSQAVKMTSLPSLADLNNPTLQIVLKDQNGDLQTFGVLGLVNAIMAELEPVDFATCFPGYADDPYWMNGINKIYTVCNEVNVGVGVFDPQFKLDVDGTTHSLRFKSGSDEGSSIALFSGFTNPGNVSSLIEVGQITGPTTEKVRFSVNNNGNVVISSTSGNALVVYNTDNEKIFQIQDDGLLRTREIRVDNNHNLWPDYVFEDEYVLMPLYKLEKYIKDNHKLPGIPSAKEIDEEGISVSEMQNLQMEKIEELTLYIINMQKQIDSLNQRIETLEKQ